MKNISIIIIGTVISFQTIAQTNNQPARNLSLKEAIEFALANNSSIKNAELDIDASRYKKKEITGMGLPQISSSFDVKDYEKLPTQLLPGQFFGAPPGTYIPVQFGVKYNATGSIQASQIVFNSDYIVALQSSKSFLELSEKNYQRSQIETKATITKAYYTALVSKERLKLLQANVDRLKKLVEDTKSLNTNGFVEKIDVTRVTVAYNNLLSEKEKIDRLVGLTESVLKFQMGMEIKSQINLTDSLHLDNIPVFDISTSSELNYKNRIEYSLLESQQRLNELDVKRGKLRYLPSIFLYGNYSAQAQRNEFDFFDASKKWYPIGIIGGTINLPLFDGFQNHYRLQQSKVNLMKTVNTMNNLKNAIDLEIETSKSSLLNALNTLNIQKTNIELAKEVYDVAKKKYEQGSGSSIEVMNAETALKEAQTNYYNALYEYFTAKVDYEKATGVIK